MAGGYSRIPGCLIARLAIDTSLRGQGHGEQLLLDAVGKAVAASEIGGGRHIVADAVDDEAQSFYEHYHFVPVRNRERRLVMKVCTRRRRSESAGGSKCGGSTPTRMAVPEWRCPCTGEVDAASAPHTLAQRVRSLRAPLLGAPSTARGACPSLAEPWRCTT
jgi:hypothetical protein